MWTETLWGFGSIDIADGDLKGSRVLRDCVREELNNFEGFYQTSLCMWMKRKNLWDCGRVNSVCQGILEGNINGI